MTKNFACDLRRQKLPYTIFPAILQDNMEGSIGSDHFTDWRYISYRRFAAHILLSWLAVCILHLMWQFAIHWMLAWGFAWIGGTLVCYAFDVLNISSHPPPHMYCIYTCILLASLRPLTSFINEWCTNHVEPGFTQTQYLAVNFALAFLVLTELEYYRSYIIFTKSFGQTFSFPRLAFLANVNRTFRLSRDPWAYLTSLPPGWKHWLDGSSEPTTWFQDVFSWSHALSCTLILVFQAVSTALGFIVKRMVNPNAGGERWWELFIGVNVWFEVNNSFWKNEQRKLSVGQNEAEGHLGDNSTK
ncbi:hypothetical protein BDU57DRAFT_268413 [Ampelomyces quisqualis]|uniref:Uncharacterized protein n=1 Tax=Ampelomyces quisqualis TaxID=50730 RepID=A0A6A5QKT0_AMPQU|nr:hypothetical protein BDU57DRAFT_268413 [Ampelomyces quisqualis]